MCVCGVLCSVEQIESVGSDGEDFSYGATSHRWWSHDLSKYYLSNGSLAAGCYEIPFITTKLTTEFPCLYKL